MFHPWKGKQTPTIMNFARRLTLQEIGNSGARGEGEEALVLSAVGDGSHHVPICRRRERSADDMHDASLRATAVSCYDALPVHRHDLCAQSKVKGTRHLELGHPLNYVG